MKSSRIYLSILLFIIITALPSPAGDRGLSSVVKQLDKQIQVGTQYLLLIAINTYNHWVPLENPVKDAREIKEILLARYYIDTVIELYDENATKTNILEKFTNLKDTLQPEDSLLIFYAGHGYSEEDASSGYWIPADGGMDKIEKANWLTNHDILDAVTRIKAAHICLLADACFSGRLLGTSRDHTSIPDPSDIPYFRRAYKLTSRQVITSGSAETVPDTSEFAKQVKLVLETNTATFLDPVMLYDKIRLGVYDTLPLIGHLKDTGHQEGAAFLLFLKDRSGSIMVHVDQGGMLYLNNNLYRKIEAGEFLIQNLDPGNYSLTIEYETGHKEAVTAEVKMTEITEVYFKPPPLGIPDLSLVLSGGIGFSFMDKMSRIAAPSFSTDVTGVLTFFKVRNTGFALRFGGSFVFDSVIDDYGLTNNLLFTGPFAGISGGMVLPFWEGLSCWITLCGGIGYSRFIYKGAENNIFSWDPFGIGEIELQKRIGKRLIVNIKGMYMAVFYMEDVYQKVLCSVGIGAAY